MTFTPGQPINFTSLVDTIKDKYASILLNLQTLIPLGFNSLFSITGTKIFNIRPKVINPYYSARSGSDINTLTGDITQPNIGVSYLGTPWTDQLGSDFGLQNHAYSSLGNSAQPFIKQTPKLAINPSSDLIGGIPYFGNSPFIFRNHLALSNWFEDTNIRSYVDTSGTNIVVKAQSLSLLYPATESSADDTAFALIGTSIRVSTPLYNYQGTTVALTTNPGTDHTLFLIGTSVNGKDIDGQIRLKLVPNVSLGYSYGIPIGTGLNTNAGSNIVYQRPICTVFSTGTGFKVSNQTAWNEQDLSTNVVNSRFGKIYQEATSPDTSFLVNTSTEDRRIIPSYYYYNLNNTHIVDYVGYQGVVRDCVGAGGNQVHLKYNTFDSATYTHSFTGNIKQCEITNGTTSIWVKDINIEDLPVVLDDSQTLSTTNAIPWYFWLVGSIVENRITSTTPVINEGNTLQLILLQSLSPYWNTTNGIKGASTLLPSSVIKKFQPNNAFRCRIGWVPGVFQSTTFLQSGELEIQDTQYTYSCNRFSSNLDRRTIGTGTTTNGVYQPFSFNSCILLPTNVLGTDAKTYGAGNIGTSTLARSIDLEFWNIAGTNTTGTSWVSVITDSIGTSNTMSPILGTSTPFYSMKSNLGIITTTTGTSNWILNSTTTIPIGTNESLYYAGTGADGGSYWNKSFKMALVKGFTLPYSYE